MTKNEFINQLKEALKNRNVENYKDILMDYEEHFAHAQLNGKSEEEISQRLGNPKSLAMAFETKSLLTQNNQNNLKTKASLVLSSLGRLLVVAPFSILVMSLPGILIFTYLVTGWTIVGGIFIGAFAVLIIGLTGGVLALSGWMSLTLFSASLAGIGITIAAFIFMYVTTQYLIQVVSHFIKWNLNFILNKRKEA